MLVRDSAAVVVPADAFAGLLPFIPITDRSFARTDHVEAFLRVYEASGKPQPATVTATITDASDHRVLDQTMEFAAVRFAQTKTAECLVDLSLARLEPGAYLLTVKASADAGKTTAERNVRFEVK
jgi:hypothetical protein